MGNRVPLSQRYGAYVALQCTLLQCEGSQWNRNSNLCSFTYSVFLRKSKLVKTVSGTSALLKCRLTAVPVHRWYCYESRYTDTDANNPSSFYLMLNVIRKRSSYWFEEGKLPLETKNTLQIENGSFGFMKFATLPTPSRVCAEIHYQKKKTKKKKNNKKQWAQWPERSSHMYNPAGDRDSNLLNKKLKKCWKHRAQKYSAIKVATLYTPYSTSWAVFDFQSNQKWVIDPKWNKI